MPALASMTLLMTALSQAADWGKNSLWNDGRSEVAVYESVRMDEGVARQFREQLITAKEKAGAGKAHYFQMNVIQKFDTVNFPVSYLLTVVVKDVSVTDVVRMGMSLHEWKGALLKDFRDGKLTIADKTLDFAPQPGDYWEDQLPLSLRGLPFKQGHEQKVRMWDSLNNNQTNPPTVREAVIRVEGEELVRCRAGSLKSWKVTVQKENDIDMYWFDQKYPNVLTKMEKADGSKRLLYGRARWNYWDSKWPMPNILK